ncbi:hypothetical protein QQS21_006371 [Conoideocrella luteorostrata]|uniref:Methyltransferase domain-containing protein n=1 Tax=Conoideocrella luteorostrata TaxID=1105319 RepID=A0AAJ0CMR3_9HYPO|nr:hypothetical protein QQS21_006371 [Conoideocrella luteorostrata]
MTQYDAIATKYDVIKNTAFNAVEQHSFRTCVTPFLEPTCTNNVLDLACGTGFYSFCLLEWGARSLTGVDVSQAMVDGAAVRLQGSKYAERATFIQGDGLAPKLFPVGIGEGEGSFDVVTGAWFLNYASDADQLRAMFDTIALNLRPSGVFVGICMYPTDDVSSFANGVNASAWSSSGVHYTYASNPIATGQGYGFKVIATPGDDAKLGMKGVQFSSFHLRKSLYEETARAAGLKGQMEWRDCMFPEGWREKIGLGADEKRWRTLTEFPLLCTLILHKE